MAVWPEPIGNPPRRAWARRVLLVAALVGAALAGRSWLQGRDAQVRLEAELAAQKTIIEQVNQREKQRADELKQTLAQIDELKRNVKTPQQAAREIPRSLPGLSQPIVIHVPDTKPGEPPASATATLPQEDLKPLFDLIQDCHACKAQLASAAKDRADDRVKIEALSHQRDAAVKAAKGGGFWVRLKRGAKWFLIGGAVGAAAVAASRR